MSTIRYEYPDLSQAYIGTSFSDLYVPPGGVDAVFTQLTLTNTDLPTTGALLVEIAIDKPGTGYGTANTRYFYWVAGQSSVTVGKIIGQGLTAPAKVGIKCSTANKVIVYGTVMTREKQA